MCVETKEHKVQNKKEFNIDNVRDQKMSNFGYVYDNQIVTCRLVSSEKYEDFGFIIVLESFRRDEE